MSFRLCEARLPSDATSRTPLLCGVNPSPSFLALLPPLLPAPPQDDSQALPDLELAVRLLDFGLGLVPAAVVNVASSCVRDDASAAAGCWEGADGLTSGPAGAQAPGELLSSLVAVLAAGDVPTVVAAVVHTASGPRGVQPLGELK
jgi:hypothetical protein